jgi:hypothetical protein
MAARRLVIVLVVMLVISTGAALLAPTREDETTTRPETAPREPQRPVATPSGRFVRSTIDAGHPRTVRIRAGDQLALVVRSKRPQQVEIPGLGELEDVDPLSPARFDLLPPAGRYGVRLLAPNKRIGEIVVRGRRLGRR